VPQSRSNALLHDIDDALTKPGAAPSAERPASLKIIRMPVERGNNVIDSFVSRSDGS
jgi:hypothetical protein